MLLLQRRRSPRLVLGILLTVCFSERHNLAEEGGLEYNYSPVNHVDAHKASFTLSPMLRYFFCLENVSF